MPKKNEPLTVEEMTAAAEIFFPLYNVCEAQLPNASVEDVLRVMESVAKLAHRERAKSREEKTKEKFGFNKVQEDS